MPTLLTSQISFISMKTTSDFVFTLSSRLLISPHFAALLTTETWALSGVNALEDLRERAYVLRRQKKSNLRWLKTSKKQEMPGGVLTTYCSVEHLAHSVLNGR